MSQSITVDDQDMPALFRLADRISTEHQRAFLRCVAVDLTLIITSSVLGAFSWKEDAAKSTVSLISAVLMSGGLLLTVYIRSQRFEQSWYDGRAIAESIKTRAWRFMTCSDPYTAAHSEAEASKLFIETLKEVMQERRAFSALLGDDPSLAPQISLKMLEVRKLSLPERKLVYLSERISDQRKWYSKNSSRNKKAARFWFNIVLLSQASALFSSIAHVHWPNLPVNIASFFAAAAAAALAWLQLKRHRELSNSYGLAAQELAMISEQAQNVVDSDKFSIFVLDAENAISREHTMWIARRDDH